MDVFRDVWTRAALAFGLLTPIYFAAAAMATKFDLVDWRFGFGQLTLTWGPRVLIGVALFALIGLGLAFFTPPRRGMLSALVGLLIPALGLGYAAYVRQQAQGVPPIHDISTDRLDPPQFSEAVVAARAAVPGGNDLDYLNARVPDNPRFGAAAGQSAAALQQRAYADMAAIPTGLDEAQAFALALALAREQGWRLGRIDAAAGVIEATTESFWYGFTDDIIVRVRPDGSGARIDMRSASRVGVSDLGANAARMRPYLEELRRRLAAAEGAA